MSKGIKFEQGVPVVAGSIDGVKTQKKPLSKKVPNERQNIRSTTASATKMANSPTFFTRIFGKDVADQLEKTDTASREKEMEPQVDMYDDIEAHGEVLPQETIAELRKKYLVETENAEEPEEVHIAELHDETRRIKEEVPEEEYIAQLREDAQIAKNATEEPLPEELIDQAREEARRAKEAEEEPEEVHIAELRDETRKIQEETEVIQTGEEKGSQPEELDEFDEPERRSAEEQMLADYGGADSVFQETAASSASTEEVQKSEEAVEQESERDVTNEMWKEDREKYIAYRREVRKAKKAFFEKTEAYEKEKKEAGIWAYVMAAPKHDKAEAEMLEAQKVYDETLVAWRERRGDIIESFSKRQNRRLEEGSTSAKEKERIDKKNEERGEGYVNYIARREAILEHHIDNEVSTLESLRYNENEKGESKNRAVRFAKAKWNWYKSLPPKRKLLYGVGFSGLIGVAAGATGFVAGGAALAGGAFAGRRAVGGLVGAFAGLKTKEIGDFVVETLGDNALKKQHESFGQKDLGTSREARLKIRRNMRKGKVASTLAAAGAGIAVGMKATEAAASVADAFGNTGHSTFGAKNAQAGTLPGSKVQIPETDVHFGGVDIKVPEVPQEDVHFGGVDIKVPEGPQEDIHFGGVDIKVPEGPQNAEIQDILKAHGIGTEETLPVAESSAEASVTESTPEEVEMKGVYEADSSVQHELQDFLKSDPKIQEKYPNLTDVERGKIAHLLQLELAKDPAMLEEFKVRGGDWNNVWKDDTYAVKLNTDLLSEQIEKVHPTVPAPQAEILSEGNQVSEKIDTQSVPQKDVHFGGVDIKAPEGVQEDVHFGGVDIKVPEGPQEDIHFGGVDIKVPEDTSSTAESFSKNENVFGKPADINEVPTEPTPKPESGTTSPDTHMPESGDIATFDSAEEASMAIPKSSTHMPESGDIAVFPKTETLPTDTHMPESGDIATFNSAEDASIAVPKGSTHMPESGDVAVFPKTETVPIDTHMPESGDIATFSSTEEASIAVPKTETLPTDFPKEIEMKGVYEAGSSVQRELQDFLKDDPFIQEKYPNLTDAERGEIARLVQLELAKDPAMVEEFKVRGGDWNNVLQDDTYAVKLNTDVLTEQIEKVHPTSSVESGVHTGAEAVHGAPEHITAEQSKIHNEISQEYDPSRNVDTDLAQAQEIINKSGPDYLGIQTRPSIEYLYKNGVFDASVLQGQKPLIQSYWGAISHVRLQDMYDFDKELTYTIGDNAPVKMGEHVESLTVALVNKMESALANKIPDIRELISESQRANETIGELVQKIHSKLEGVDSAPVVPTDIPPVVGEVEQSTTPAETPTETAPTEPVLEKPEVSEAPGLTKTPLSEYSSVAPKLEEQSTRGILGFGLEKTWNAKLTPIEVEPTIKSLVQQRYPDPNMWPSGSAEEVMQKSSNFRSAVERQLIDIRTELNPDNTLDYNKIVVDISAYKDMTPTEMLEQLEEHASMLRKANVSIPDDGTVIKTSRY